MVSVCNEGNVGKIRSSNVDCTFRIYNGVHRQSEDEGHDYATGFVKDCDQNSR